MDASQIGPPTVAQNPSPPKMPPPQSVAPPSTSSASITVPSGKRRFRITEKADEGYLNLRSGPGMTNDVIAQMPVGTTGLMGNCVRSTAATYRSARWNGMASTDGRRPVAWPTWSNPMPMQATICWLFRGQWAIDNTFNCQVPNKSETRCV